MRNSSVAVTGADDVAGAQLAEVDVVRVLSERDVRLRLVRADFGRPLAQALDQTHAELDRIGLRLGGVGVSRGGNDAHADPQHPYPADEKVEIGRLEQNDLRCGHASSNDRAQRAVASAFLFHDGKETEAPVGENIRSPTC